MPLLTLVFIGVCFIILYSSVKIVYPKLQQEHRRYQLMKKLPGSPINNCILGNLPEVLVPFEELPSLLENLLSRHGRVARTWIPFFPQFTIGRADYAKWFFNSEDTAWKADHYQLMEPVLGKGLVTSNGEEWHQQRKLLNPTFNFSILTTYCDIFADNSMKLIRKLKSLPSNSAVDTTEEMNLITLDIICETAMGMKVNSLDNPTHEFRTAIKSVYKGFLERTMKPWYWNDFLFFTVFPAGREFKKSQETLCSFAENIVQAKKRERAQKHAKADARITDEFTAERKRLAFLDLLMDTAETQSVRLSDKVLLDEVVTILAAGYEATASALGFILYLLGLHPDIQDKCCAELNHIFNGSDRKPRANDLQDMEYISRVIKESLRMFPTVPITSKKTLRDTQIGEFMIPKGTTINLDIFHLHRDQKYFPEPEKFDPDRFSPENSANRHAYAYVPFAAGPRNCIGQRFAMMEMKTILSYILRNFVIESLHGEKELRILFATSLWPSRKLEAKFLPRNRITT